MPRRHPFVTSFQCRPGARSRYEATVVCFLRGAKKSETGPDRFIVVVMCGIKTIN